METARDQETGATTSPDGPRAQLVSISIFVSLLNIHMPRRQHLVGLAWVVHALSWGGRGNGTHRAGPGEKGHLLSSSIYYDAPANPTLRLTRSLYLAMVPTLQPTSRLTLIFGDWSQAGFWDLNYQCFENKGQLLCFFIFSKDLA